MKPKTLLLITTSILGSIANAQNGDAYRQFQQALGEEAWIGAESNHPLAHDVTRPRPSLEALPLSASKQQLGFDLFHERGLSSNGSVACNSCHMGMLGGSDARPTSVGIGGAIGSRNSPSVLNAAFNFRQFWDGRSFTLDEQALEPLSNPLEMGHDISTALTFLSTDPQYADRFAAIYPDGVTAANLGDALSQHVKGMTRTDSRFNAYLAGDAEALTAQERRGYQRFNELGCTACHNGINLGGNSYQSISLVNTYRPDDTGLFARSGKTSDIGAFKVPSLHNVALTAPYFHDGQTRDLSTAVSTMAIMTTGQTLSDDDRNDIVAFLGSLSSEFFSSHGQNGGGMHGAGMGGNGMHQGGGMHGGGMPGGGMHGGGMHGGGMHGNSQQQGGMHSGNRGRGMQGNGMHGGGSHGGGMHAGNAQGNGHQNTQQSAQQQSMANAFLAEIDNLGQQNSGARVLTQDHSQDYLNIIEQAQLRSRAVQTEMQRILDGTVQHYDFLQFEHSELLKFANALTHPPATLPTDIRSEVVEHAETLLRKVESMEWLISDFLRTIATTRVAEASPQSKVLIFKGHSETVIEDVRLLNMENDLQLLLTRYNTSI